MKYQILMDLYQITKTIIFGKVSLNALSCQTADSKDSVRIS